MPPVSLVGLPGSGKSTVGRQLARRLGWNLVDLDADIETRIGCPIREYFERHGEASFRDIEQEALAAAVGHPSLVISTGGGIVLREANRQRLRAGSTCIYLRSRPEELMRRLRHDTQRPLLQVGNPLQKLRELQAQREPLYQQVAQFTFDTGRTSIHTLVNMILMQVELAGIVPADQAPATVGRDAAVRPAL